MIKSPYTIAQQVLDEGVRTWPSTPLMTIFSVIGESSQSPPPMYLATQRLRFDRGVLFPMPADMARSQSLPNMDYSYQQASSHLQPGNEQVRLEQTLALLHEYGWAAA